MIDEAVEVTRYRAMLLNTEFEMIKRNENLDNRFFKPYHNSGTRSDRCRYYKRKRKEYQPRYDAIHLLYEEDPAFVDMLKIKLDIQEEEKHELDLIHIDELKTYLEEFDARLSEKLNTI